MKIRTRMAWLAAGMALLACEIRPNATEAAEQTLKPRLVAGQNGAARRRALLVGIDDYSASTLGAPRAGAPDRDWQNLYGAVNDVESMREMLELLYGFQPGEIQVLKNQEATRDAILRALETHLQNGAGAGDVIFFYYSGHGSQVANSRSSEPDKLDESIVPADSRLGARDILDKDLRKRFNSVLDRGARLTVILDSCHSGSGIRNPFQSAVGTRAVRPDPRDVADASPEGPRPEDRGAIVISATQDHETAREMPDDHGRYRGVFSWAWLRALRRAAADEPVGDTFLRAQALVRAESASQDPVLAGSEAARATPFLNTVRAPRGGLAMAIEKVERDGTIVVQGGWAHGLTAGSELRLLHEGREVRMRVTKLLGVGRCEARTPGTRAGHDGVTPGALVELAGWVVPPARPLRVWMPHVVSIKPVVEWAEALRTASRKRVRWIDDPTGQTPTHLLRWRNDAWELAARDSTRRVPAGAAPDDVLAMLPEGASLFVQLPAPGWLTGSIAIGPGTDLAAIEPVGTPEQADYILAGRSSHGTADYAWLRASLSADDGRRALPSRTAWRSTSIGADVALLLQDSVVRLRRIHAWQLAESPPGSASPYELEVRHFDGAPVRGRVLVGEERYRLALRIRQRASAAPARRYFYAFMIDSSGKSVLLYPLATRGSVENQFPLEDRSAQPVIPLDAAFVAMEPYGIDTYFLLTTDDPLPDPAILEGSGVRGERQPSALEDLLMATDAGRRGGASVMPANWSIERVMFDCVPPKTKGVA